jgi:hypothetical protein
MCINTYCTFVCLNKFGVSVSQSKRTVKTNNQGKDNNLQDHLA